MASIVDKLIADHQGLERLVRLLDSRSISVERAAEPNAALLVDALYYLTRFPDVDHHALEDRIIERLIARKALAPELGSELSIQHATLAHLGHELIQDLESMVRNENMSCDLLQVHIRLYAERLRHNMAIEELTLFPAARRHLDDEDWSLIEKAAPCRSVDPLFQTPVHERFAELRRVIAAEAACGCKDHDIPRD
ncbi:hemerythrin domain-containing protein [Burkholderia pseudomallei]|uniref:hemerythrin domain-containing protein n=1 Tax=Burkholderia pseudomallei TaxID=28450 RepID=UPI001AD73A55|nr:hemerythrin domain-containing protein [Burkholderia pseudomallei]MBO7752375.1 hemerythrin domain-containing protein [Burkholderia pseudomallei]